MEINMRITAIELQYEDIMWFGIDNNNHIFECTSAGCGNVPEFVCISKENTESLLNFFMNELAEFTEEKVAVEYDDTNSLLKDCIHLSRKGLYCYDVYEDDEQLHMSTEKSVNRSLKIRSLLTWFGTCRIPAAGAVTT